MKQVVLVLSEKMAREVSTVLRLAAEQLQEATYQPVIDEIASQLSGHAPAVGQRMEGEEGTAIKRAGKRMAKAAKEAVDDQNE